MEQENRTDKLLEVRDLQVSFFTPAGEVKAVNGISYDVNYDEVMLSLIHISEPTRP